MPFRHRIYGTKGISPTVMTKTGGGREVKILENTNKSKELEYYAYPNSNKKHQSNTFYDKDYISPTLDTMQGGNTQPKILRENKNATVYGCCYKSETWAQCCNRHKINEKEREENE